MPTPTTKISEDLGKLIKRSRKHSRLTQAEAAEKAGISTAWQAQIETGFVDQAATDTLLEMLAVVNTPVRAVRSIGYADLAAELEEHYDWFAGEAL